MARMNKASYNNLNIKLIRIKIVHNYFVSVN